MTKKWNGRRLRAGFSLGIVITAMAVAPGMVTAAESNEAGNRLLALETQAGALSQQIGGMSAQLSGFMPVPPHNIAETAPRIEVAQSSRDMGSLNLRLGQLEEQIRTMTGQVEGLQFQMTQLQTLLERMQEDNDARFGALEGNGLGKTDAAPQSSGVTPSGGASQPMDLTAPGDFSNATDLSAPTGLENSQGEDFTLGAPETSLGTLNTDDLSNGLGQPLDLGGGSSADAMVTDADANAQYQAGYDAVVRGDYAFAEDQFRQFIALFPDHPQAPDATNWLGEALIQRGEFDEAADILLTGFQSYPSSSRAPDMLLKLGVALTGAGEYDTACRTFGEVQRRFPDVSPAFRTRLAEEAGLAQC